MQVNYFPAEYFTSLVGVNFSFPEKEIKGVEYMGDGPYRVWKNRMKGNQFGIWKKNTTIQKPVKSWIYPEFKGYHCNMYWCKFITTMINHLMFTLKMKMYFFACLHLHGKQTSGIIMNPFFQPAIFHLCRVFQVLALKHNVNETTGPMGMKNIFYDYEKDPRRASMT